MDSSQFRHEVLLNLRALALAFPEVVEGDSCVKRSFKVRKKSFLFLGEKPDEFNIMVKLGPSMEEAATLAQARPKTWTVGKAGWATFKFDPSEKPQEGLMERWIEESYRLQAPKALLAKLDAA